MTPATADLAVGVRNRTCRATAPYRFGCLFTLPPRARRKLNQGLFAEQTYHLWLRIHENATDELSYQTHAEP
jgi:hypothetical protein